MSGSVLVTGGAGFIGSHIAEAYLAAGWSVTCLDDLSRGKREQVPSKAAFVQADVRGTDAFHAVADGKFDVVVHQAAQIDVRISVDEPAVDASINLVGFANILAAVAAGKVKRVVFASSGGVVYGDPAILPTPEPTANLPISPYGVSKLAGEHYLRVLGALHGFEGVALRYANVYGPRQDPASEAGVVSIFVSRLLAGKPLTVFGDGTQTRDYVFVKDVARANLLAATVAVSRGDRLDVPAFNIATGHETSVNDLAAHVGRALDRTPVIQYAPARPGELYRSCLDVSKAARELNWRPEVVFDDGMKELAAWFQGTQPVNQDTTAVANTGFLHLVLGATLATQVVLAICALFSIASWYVIAAKWWEFRRIASARKAFYHAIRRTRNTDDRLQAMAGVGESPYAEIIRRSNAFLNDLRGVMQRDGVARTGLSLTQLEALMLLLEAGISETIDETRRLIPVLAITGATAPLLGLFGTVIGIINAFLGIASGGTGNIAAVGPGIADALIATAAGLGAAIPAVIAYNVFTGRSERLEGELERVAQDTIGALGREGTAVAWRGCAGARAGCGGGRSMPTSTSSTWST